MKIVKKFLDNLQPHFEDQGKLKHLYYFWEAFDTFLMTPSFVAKGKVHIRDGLDLKRMMTFVLIALIPCILFGMYNTGLQANYELQLRGIHQISGIRGSIFSLLGLWVDPYNVVSCFVHGALYFIPVYIVTMITGLFWEVLFSTVRKEEVSEGFFVTGILFPCILPATIPLWQVAVGISFGVIVGKEIFGGTGMNFLNPALLARAFLFFAYPGEISGDLVWVAADGHSGATALSVAASSGVSAIKYSMNQSFLGFIPGAMGETSALCALIGAVFLVITKIASFRIIIGGIVGTIVLAFIFNLIGSATNPMFAMNPWWHMTLGGYAFGLAFMATDPVTAPNTIIAQYVYGLLIGAMVVIVRVINPAYPEGVMLAILFANVFGPLMDYFVINANIKRRAKRCQMTV